MRRNMKIISFGAILLVIIVAISVTLALVLTNDEVSDDPQSRDVWEIVGAIRSLMEDPEIANEPIFAYIIPSVDAHQTEYISSRDRRMRYVTGFTGSAGTAIIAKNISALWTDSRYHIQAEQQIDSELWTLMKSGLPDVPTYRDWLISILPPNSNVGVDPFLMESTDFNSLLNFLTSYGHNLVGISENLVDKVWGDERPTLNLLPLEPLHISFSGKNISAKLNDIREEIKKLGAETHIIPILDNIAWLLNTRGKDIQNNPVFYSYVIITQTELRLYLLDLSRNTTDLLEHFSAEGVNVIVCDYDDILVDIELVLDQTEGKMLLYHTSQAINAIIPANRRLNAESPLVMMKVVKNPVEAEGLRKAHIRDGVAVIRYLYWLEMNVDSGNITELTGPIILGEFRRQQEHNRGLSFGAISAVGANAAMAHYSPTEETAKYITRSEVYLIDSGGQYLDGTTDITRTIHLGTPTAEEQDAFTRVLKGAISLSTTKFPPRAPFSFFDAMARRYLWDVGLDYGHGTGHGIGAFLSVHEYPPRISSSNSGIGILKNMFTSNEPGYYKESEFGIRIEDIVQVVESETTINDFDGLGALEFYDITMVPIQTSLINIELLTTEEINWLNEFHERVLTTTAELLQEQDPPAYEWLVEQTKAISWDTNTCSALCSKIKN